MKKYFLAIFIFFNVNIISEVKIEDCTSIESDAKRLACYDYLVTGMSKSIDDIDVTTSGNSEERISSSADKNSNFGLSRRQINESRNSNSRNVLNASIKAISKTFGGKTRFKLSNNQLWETQSVVSSKLGSFKEKSDIRIEEASMGGFWMINKSSKVRIKVKRIS